MSDFLTPVPSAAAPRAPRTFRSPLAAIMRSFGADRPRPAAASRPARSRRRRGLLAA